MLKTRNIIMLLDTETVATRGNAQTVHDIGYLVYNKKTAEILTSKRFLISELHIDNVDYLDKSPFYTTKKRLYDADKTNFNYNALMPYRYAIIEMLEDMKAYKVTTVSAYNLDFDINALISTCKAYAETLTDRLTSKLNKLAHIDLYRLACYSILRTQTYINYALQYNLASHSGKNIGSGAECCYRYINNNPDYIEQHTALADVYDELEILKYLITNLHKRDILDNQIYGIDNQAWKKVTAFARELAMA